MAEYDAFTQDFDSLVASLVKRAYHPEDYGLTPPPEVDEIEDGRFTPSVVDWLQEAALQVLDPTTPEEAVFDRARILADAAYDEL